MKQSEAALVLAKINAHHGNAPMSDLQLKCFHEELRPYVTLPLAMQAVSDFYASDVSGRWMGSGDVNAYALRAIRSCVPSEAEIERMAIESGFSGGENLWQFRRSLLKSCGAGVPVEEARRIAVRQASSPVIGGPSENPGANKGPMELLSGGYPSRDTDKG